MQTRLQSIAITSFFSLIPILVYPFTKEIFEFPKILILYFATGVLLLTYGAYVLPRITIDRKSIIEISILIILIAASVSTFFSIEKYTSLFGYYTRFNGGLISLICIAIWTSFLIRSKLSISETNSLLTGMVISASFIAIYAILQRIGVDKSLWTEDSSKRVFSTLGQPNWLAAYLIPNFYISLYVGIKFGRNLFLKILPAAVIYVAIWFTYSISGIIGFIMSLIVFGILQRKSLRTIFRRYWVYVILVLIISSLISIPLAGRLNSQYKNLQNINEILTAENLSKFKPDYGDTGKIRLVLWQGTLNLIVSSPKQFFIGSGPETFVYVFTKYKPESINITSESEFVHNKPHNWYLEIFANQGLLGFLSLIFFIAASIYIFLNNQRDNLSIFLFSGWVSILVTNFFGWPTVALSILFFSLPILFNYQYIERTSYQSLLPRNILGILNSLAGSFLIITSIVLFVSDISYKEGQYHRATIMNPFEPRYKIASMIYDEDINTSELLKFYIFNKDNPYVVKTLVNFIDYKRSIGLQNEGLSIMESVIKADARENSPADKQFEK